MSWKHFVSLPHFVPTGGCSSPLRPEFLYVYSQDGYVKEIARKEFVKKPSEGRNLLVLEPVIRRMKLRARDFKKTRPFVHLQEEDFAKMGFSDERGLLGMAWDPKDANVFYAFFSASPRDFMPKDPGADVDHVSVLARFLAHDGDTERTFRSMHVIMVHQERNFNHNGGAIEFGPDGHLYVAVGDGGGFFDRNGKYLVPSPTEEHPEETERLGNAQDLSSANGKILRVSPNTGREVRGNPHVIRELDREAEELELARQARLLGEKHPNALLVQGDSPDLRVYHLGLRNPWKMSFDAAGGLWIADVGQNEVEEVSVAWPGEGGGLNFGWKAFEGDRPLPEGKGVRRAIAGGKVTMEVKEMEPQFPGISFTRMATLPQGGVRVKRPIITYGHDFGVAVIGGYLYGGKAIPSMRGKYVFGEYAGPRDDMVGGKIMVASGEYGSDERKWSFETMTRLEGLDLHGFAKDADGELYALSATSFRGSSGRVRNGVVYKLEPKLAHDPFGILDSARQLMAKGFGTDFRVPREGEGKEEAKGKFHVSVYDARVAAFFQHEEPGAWEGSVDVAKRKAFAAHAFSSDENAVSTRDLFAFTQPGQPLWNIHTTNPRPGLVVFPGGLPLYDVDGKLVGGVGVSGDSVDNDEGFAFAIAYDPLSAEKNMSPPPGLLGKTFVKASLLEGGSESKGKAKWEERKALF